MDKITIYENFLSEEELHTCQNIIHSRPWGYGQVSQKSNFSTPFWMMVLNEVPFFSDLLKKKIEHTIGRKFHLNRVYANGQTFGQDGSFHQDDTKPNTYTFCWYASHFINRSNADDIGGNIIFKIPNDERQICIEPLYNRGVFFPATYFHKGLSFNRYWKGLRISIAWKFEEIKE